MAYRVVARDDEFALYADGELIEAGLDATDLADLIYEAIEDGDLEAEEVVAIEDDQGRRGRRAAALCTPAQRRALGWVIGGQPIGGQFPDR